MENPAKTDSSGFFAVVRRITAAWAILGGVVLILVVSVNMFSVIGGLFASPFPGDFELTQMGIAISVFAFLPYCQVTGANVTADIFTSAASARTIAFLTFLGAVIALLFSGILLWRMFYGMLDQKEFDYTTAILSIPQWLAYVPILISLALLALAAVATLLTEAETMRSGGDHV
ncbi:TRAP transporter small permease [Oceaniglobus ichthyenteri]|uniref:TRAP transporter small permease n=1 Tax=Oceaniglobus ichthyenteri TaxID=2136177 RepID=UPI000D349341|nr:TRAP transporter small permease [Oceaniglobus ichthyenteri]